MRAGTFIRPNMSLTVVQITDKMRRLFPRDYNPTRVPLDTTFIATLYRGSTADQKHMLKSPNYPAAVTEAKALVDWPEEDK